MNLLWFLQPTIKYSSKIHGNIIIGSTSGEKAVITGIITQSGGEITAMYHQVIDSLYTHHFQPKNILLLGVGAGTVITQIRRLDKKVPILGIELDPVMLQIAKKHFSLKQSLRQTYIQTDAISYIEKTVKSSSFDLIIVDLFVGPLNPAKARTKQFLQKLKDTITPHGTILYNAHYQKKKAQEYTKFKHHADGLFSTVREVFSYPLNRVLVLEK